MSTTQATADNQSAVIPLNDSSNANITLLDLPPVLLSKIFRNLHGPSYRNMSKFELVCKLFRDFAYSEIYTALEVVHLQVYHKSLDYAYSKADFDRLVPPETNPEEMACAASTSKGPSDEVCSFDHIVKFNMNGLCINYRSLTQFKLPGLLKRATKVTALCLEAPLLRYSQNYPEKKVHKMLDPLLRIINQYSTAPFQVFRVEGYFMSSPTLPVLTQKFSNTLQHLLMEDPHNHRNYYDLSVTWDAIKKTPHLKMLRAWHYTDPALEASLHGKSLESLILFYVPRVHSDLPAPTAPALARTLCSLTGNLHELYLVRACFRFSLFLCACEPFIGTLRTLCFDTKDFYCDSSLVHLPRLLTVCPDLTTCLIKRPREEDAALFIAEFLLKYANFTNSSPHAVETDPEAQFRKFYLEGSPNFLSLITSTYARHHNPNNLRTRMFQFISLVQNHITAAANSSFLYANYNLNILRELPPEKQCQIQIDFQLANAKLTFKSDKFLLANN